MGLAQQPEGRFVVGVAVKDALPVDATDDVLADIADRGAGGAGHADDHTSRKPPASTEKENVPLSIRRTCGRKARRDQLMSPIAYRFPSLRHHFGLKTDVFRTGIVKGSDQAEP